LFVIVVVLQELIRSGFDRRRHPLSSLSLGDLGWIQVANFVVCGLLAVVSPGGLRRVLRSRVGAWGPVLVATYVLGLIWVACSPPTRPSGTQLARRTPHPSRSVGTRSCTPSPSPRPVRADR
jgi:hypothetical protein